MNVIAIFRERIDEIVRLAADHSDRDIAGLTFWAEAFVSAHTAAPFGLSIEIGSREGGGSLMFLKLIEMLYPSETLRPMLFTVDPYGFKPPDHAQVGDVFGFYGHGAYVAQKKLLADYPNHAHFLLPSTTFLQRLRGAPYWVPGAERKPTKLTRPSGGAAEEWVSVPVGEQQTIDRATFVLLDGDHAAATVAAELELLWWSPRLMHPQGVVVVDDVDHDPATLPHIAVNYVIGSQGARCATVVGAQ